MEELVELLTAGSAALDAAACARFIFVAMIIEFFGIMSSQASRMGR